MQRTAFLALLLALLALPLCLSAAGAAAIPAAPAAEKMSILLDLNTAGRDELLSVRGIGPSLAGKIIEYRSAHGPFTRLEQLLEVKGIGEKSLARLRKYFTLSPSPSPEANVTPPVPR